MAGSAGVGRNGASLAIRFSKDQRNRDVNRSDRSSKAPADRGPRLGLGSGRERETPPRRLLAELIDWCACSEGADAVGVHDLTRLEPDLVAFWGSPRIALRPQD
jgi:hypothetical protein